jgi:hypothetical protein
MGKVLGRTIRVRFSAEAKFLPSPQRLLKLRDTNNSFQFMDIGPFSPGNKTVKRENRRPKYTISRLKVREALPSFFSKQDFLTCGHKLVRSPGNLRGPALLLFYSDEMS